MGYGLDTTKYPHKRWGKIILYKGQAKGKLQEAFFRWHEGTGVMFTSCAQGENIELQWGTHSSGPMGNPGHGNVNKLCLKEDLSLGTMLHELGHVLGIAHENDRPDCRDAFYGSTGEGSHLLFGIEQAERAAAKKSYLEYDAPNLGGTIMQYPEKYYLTESTPTQSDFDLAKTINGW